CAWDAGSAGRASTRTAAVTWPAKATRCRGELSTRARLCGFAAGSLGFASCGFGLRSEAPLSLLWFGPPKERISICSWNARPPKVKAELHSALQIDLRLRISEFVRDQQRDESLAPGHFCFGLEF